MKNFRIAFATCIFFLLAIAAILYYNQVGYLESIYPAGRTGIATKGSYVTNAFTVGLTAFILLIIWLFVEVGQRKK